MTDDLAAVDAALHDERAVVDEVEATARTVRAVLWARRDARLVAAFNRDHERILRSARRAAKSGERMRAAFANGRMPLAAVVKPSRAFAATLRRWCDFIRATYLEQTSL